MATNSKKKSSGRISLRGKVISKKISSFLKRRNSDLKYALRQIREFELEASNGY